MLNTHVVVVAVLLFRRYYGTDKRPTEATTTKESVY